MPRVRSGSRERLVPIDGQPPDLIKPPKGCGFVDRCPHAMQICREIPPEDFTISEGHCAKCWLLHPEAAEQRRKAQESR